MQQKNTGDVIRVTPPKFMLYAAHAADTGIRFIEHGIACSSSYCEIASVNELYRVVVIRPVVASFQVDLDRGVVISQGWKNLIPIYRWAVLFRGVGLSPWLSLVMLLPGINLVLLIIFYFYLARVFRRSYFMVLGLIVLPVIFLPIFAFGEGKCDHYQPHAKLVDQPYRLPVQQKKNIGKNQPIYKVEANPVPKKSSVTAITTIQIAGDEKPAPLKFKRVRKRRYFDMARVPRRKKKIVAKTLTEVIPGSKQNQQKPKTGPVKVPTPRRTRPMPGDIRAMKNNIVVVGPLQETPKAPVPQQVYRNAKSQMPNIKKVV